MMPLGLWISLRNCSSMSGSMPTLFQVEADHRRSSTRIDDLSPNIVGSHADAHVDRVAADVQLDAAVLGQAALGDVEVRHDLDAGS